MNEHAKICPICPRGCDLSSPHCERGAEYTKTGNLPQERGHNHGHRRPNRLTFQKREQQLVMKYLHHATGAADRGCITQEHTDEMFSVLTEEETVCLAGLLEKLSDHWIKMTPDRPARHGRP